MIMEILSLSEAKAINSPIYFTGKPCKRGHVACRSTKNGMCADCAVYHRNTPKTKSAQKIYRKKYYSNNKDHVNSKSISRRASIQKTKPYILLIQGAKKRANAKCIDFEIDVAWAESRWTGACELTGIVFTEYSEAGDKEFSPSIDKINSSLGYTKNNCRFILNCVNRFKGIMSDNEMNLIASRLLNKRLAVGIPVL